MEKMEKNKNKQTKKKKSTNNTFFFTEQQLSLEGVGKSSLLILRCLIRMKLTLLALKPNTRSGMRCLVLT